ncbi:MAG TPA: hypothetical protein VH413_18815 [Verrucomicrobiae bacterium]|jgi:hypothetical protein|nr:hypothetical protein [Verrucomicrobiae bacterium]
MANNLETGKKVMAVSMLAEGNSIRSIERMTGIHRDTVMRLGVRVGEACAKIQDEKMRGLTCPQIEVDEIWGFIGKKKKMPAHSKPLTVWAMSGRSLRWMSLPSSFPRSLSASAIPTTPRRL